MCDKSSIEMPEYYSSINDLSVKDKTCTEMGKENIPVERPLVVAPNLRTKTVSNI